MHKPLLECNLLILLLRRHEGLSCLDARQSVLRSTLSAFLLVHVFLKVSCFGARLKSCSRPDHAI
jgi:hypothetical protein